MEPEEPKDLAYCVSMLSGGYVQSFVDFFYLLHGEGKEEPAGQDVQESKEDECDLDLVTEKLRNAEKARRTGAPSQVYKNYRELADYYCSIKQPKTGIYFYEKCLRISQLVGDIEEEKNANFQLGVASQAVPGSTCRAIKFHEAHLQLSFSTKDENGMGLARKQLAKVYEVRASELEKDNTSESLKLAVSFLEKCVELALEESDDKAFSSSNFRLGCAYNRLGLPDKAIPALRHNYQYCEKTNDTKAQGEACANLAEAYLQTPEKDKAIAYLEQCLAIAEEINNVDMQAFACRSIGSVQTQCGDYDKAVHYFQKNFSLTREKPEVNLEEVNHARVLLGIAMKNAQRGEYLKMVRQDLHGLLSLKVSS